MTPQEYQDTRDTLIVAESRLERALKDKADKATIQTLMEAVKAARSRLDTLIRDATVDERRAVTVDLTRKAVQTSGR